VIEITDELAIPENEIIYTASRSGGPGGQHVNKVSSRVTLRFDVAASPSLTDEQKQRIMTRLATRLSKDGVLSIVAQQQRSQAANRHAALARFVALLRAALAPETPRRPTKPAKEAMERRLTEKKRRSRLKQERSSDAAWDN
jgi:ribosome-associated protein